MMAKDATHQTLGELIAAKRAERGMTLETLANETGQTPESLQQIESGDLIPPVAVVLSLSRILGLYSDSLLQGESESEPRTDQEQAVRVRTDHYSYRLLTPHLAQQYLKAFHVTIDAAADLEGPGYQHQGEEFTYVLQGEVVISVGENTNHLRQGDSLHYNSGIVHKLRNPGDTPCELLVVLYVP